MTAPIDLAYAALCDAVGEALTAAEFISDASALEVDPASVCEPSGDETTVQTAALIVRLDTDPIRPLMGGGAERWVVDQGYRVELAAFGPNAAGEPDYKARLMAAVDALAVIPGADATLGQTCERLTLTGAEDDDLPPKGMKVSVGFTIRIRAGDPLGRTAP